MAGPRRMAPAGHHPHHQKASKFQKMWNKFVKPAIDEIYSLIVDPCKAYVVASILLLVEVVVNVVVIEKVPYTEIDWLAYMQEVEGVIVNGTTDYSLLKGDTGPLVYPAGFVWFYAALYKLTDSGVNIRLGQYIFAGMYVIVLGLVFRLMCKSRKLPPYVLILMSCTSYRIHSIFVLRLFNDPVCMMFLYAAINAFVENRWSLGSILFSLAVSVKMNILLFAPALFLAYLSTQGLFGTFKQLIICASIQLILAYPFLSTHPWSYIKGAFDLGRIFLFKWTVNWRFLPEDIFVHPGLHIGLLAVHAGLLLLFMLPWWKLLQRYKVLTNNKVGPVSSIQLLLLPLFMSNFVGLVVARSLHYQFYVWYYHQIPYLLWSTPFPIKLRLLLWGLIELAWNTYPSTIWSSALLHLAHVTVLIGLFLYLRNIEKDAAALMMTKASKKQK